MIFHALNELDYQEPGDYVSQMNFDLKMRQVFAVAFQVFLSRL